MRIVAALGGAVLLGLAACDAQTASTSTPATEAAAPSQAPASGAAADLRASVQAAPSAGLAPLRAVYPITETAQQVDDYFGEVVSDPYRWLEADVREDEKVADWVERQNTSTNAFLEALPHRAAIKARLTELWNFERYGVPEKQGGRYFFTKNDGLQNQSVLYVQDDLSAESRVLIDPNAWSDDGATALAGFWPSPDGGKLAYAVQDGGSDWLSIRVLDIATGETRPGSIEWVKFSDVAWNRESTGFWYARYPEPAEGAAFQNLNFNQKVYFHQIDQDQSDDALVYERPQAPDHGFGAETADDGRWLVITVHIGTDDRYELVAFDLDAESGEPIPLVSGFENDYALAGANDGKLVFRTNRNAPLGRVVAIDPYDPGEDKWTEIVPQSEATLVDAAIVGDKLIIEYLEDAKSAVRAYPLAGGEPSEIALPGLGSASGFEGEAGDPETFFTFSSFATPPSIYRFDAATGETSAFKTPKAAFDPNDFEVRQVFYPSKDGTSIPMFIANKKSSTPDVARPTLLYGYGGFNISMTPAFTVQNLAWMEMGGVYALANLRGGGEYGADWHDAGRRANKQNVFDDFAAAAEYLIGQKITTADQLAIFGRSNGGLLVGATINQRPELFAAALPAVGVMDMLRFNKFTAGRFWTDDYGDPQVEADYKVLRAYSPYHNIKDGQNYPATLVTTADTDDRVVPGHSFKYIARLQAAQGGQEPVLIRIETRAGHGAGKPTDKLIEEFADQWAFIAHYTGLTAE